MRPTLAVVLSLLLAPAAHAWNATGHGTVAAIAYDVLAASTSSKSA